MTIISVILAILISFFLGPFGTIIVLSIILGLVVSNYKRNKIIESDLKKIKEKLGIEESAEFNLTDEEIENELESELLSEEERMKLKEINNQIENELEEYSETDGNKKQNQN